MVHLSHSYMTTGKTIALTIGTFVSKVMSLLFNTLSRFVIAFLPKTKRLLISWLQSPYPVILEPRKENLSLFPLFPHLFATSDGIRYRDLNFLNVEFLASFFTLLFHLHQEAVSFYEACQCMLIILGSKLTAGRDSAYSRKKKISQILLCIWKCPMWCCLSENNPVIAKWRKLLQYWNIVEMNI